MYGFAFPKGTPKAICDKWEQAIANVLKNPELQDKMKAAGFIPQFLSGKDYDAFSRHSVEFVQEMLKYNEQDSN